MIGAVFIDDPDYFAIDKSSSSITEKNQFEKLMQLCFRTRMKMKISNFYSFSTRMFQS